MKKSQLERMLKTEIEMRTHYQELTETAINELRFNKLQLETLLTAIEETKELLEQEVSNKIIINVLTNYLQRMNLDTSIHNNLIGKASSPCCESDEFDV